MNALNVILSLIFGVWLGILYCGGVWLTARHSLSVRRPKTLLVASMTARFILVLVCFSAVLNGSRWDRLIACVSGYLFVRLVLAASLKSGAHEQTGVAQLARRAQ